MARVTFRIALEQVSGQKPDIWQIQTHNGNGIREKKRGFEVSVKLRIRNSRCAQVESGRDKFRS